MHTETNDTFISFVVPTLNNAELAPRLVKTARLLAGFSCEFCISDGGSTDDTLSYLEQCSNVRIIRSDPDQGIYDAWNRAIPSCRGEYLAFMGIDDEPQLPFLQAAKKIYESGYVPGVIYGDALFRNGYRQLSTHYPEKPSLFEDARPKFDIANVGALHHRSLFLSEMFDPTFRLAGDLEFYLRKRHLIRKKGYRHVPLFQAVIDANGVSRNPNSVSCYINEFSRIEKIHSIQLIYPTLRVRMFSLLGRWPGLYKMLKDVSWIIRGSRNV